MFFKLLFIIEKYKLYLEKKRGNSLRLLQIMMNKFSIILSVLLYESWLLIWQLLISNSIYIYKRKTACFYIIRNFK